MMAAPTASSRAAQILSIGMESTLVSLMIFLMTSKLCKLMPKVLSCAFLSCI